MKKMLFVLALIASIGTVYAFDGHWHNTQGSGHSPHWLGSWYGWLHDYGYSSNNNCAH